MAQHNNRLLWATIVLLAALATSALAQLYLNMRSVDEEQSRRLLEHEKMIYENQWRLRALEERMTTRK